MTKKQSTKTDPCGAADAAHEPPTMPKGEGVGWAKEIEDQIWNKYKSVKCSDYRELNFLHADLIKALRRFDRKISEYNSRPPRHGGGS